MEARSRDDLASAYLDALPFDPYPVQEEALLAWFTCEQGVLVCAPTGTGKTIIAEAALFEALHTGKTAYYTTPLIALTEQKFREMQAAAVRWGFRPDDVGLVTGNRKVNPDARVLVVVAEILLNRLLHPEAFAFEDVSAVVMDEFHSFNDPERGVVWELSLALLPPHIRLLLLSATVGNTADFLIWLRTSHRRKVDLIQSTERKVPLTFEWVGERLLPEQLELMAEGTDETRRTPALVFCFNRAECWSVAELLRGKALLRDGQQKELATVLDQWDWSLGVGPKLKPILYRGIGVHHAGMLPKYRRRVEELFQARLLSVCVCTETLAAGINLPARSVLLTSLMKGPPGKQKLIDPSSAHQMFGRAGRPQFDTSGYVYSIAHEDDVRIARWKQQYDQIPEGTKDPNLLRAKKALKKKMPTRREGVQYWNEAQFQKIVASPPAKLASRGELPWRLLAYLLTLSPEVARLREFVHKRLLDDAARTKGIDDLHRMLLTLWAGEYIDLLPAPPAELQRERGPLRPPLEMSVPDAPSVRDAGAAPPVEEEFGTGLDSPSERGEFSDSGEGASVSRTGDRAIPENSQRGEEGRGEREQRAAPLVPPSPQSSPPLASPARDSESLVGEREVTGAQPQAMDGLFGSLLQQAREGAKPQATAAPKPKLSAAAKLLIGDRAVDAPPPPPPYTPDRAYPNESLNDLLVFRSVNPLYGRFLIDVLGPASREERVQALESVLELPASLVPQVRVPSPERMPPGPLARGWLDDEIVRRGIASVDDLYPKSFAEEDDPQKRFGGPQRRFAIPCADKLRMLFDHEFPGVGGLRTTAVWVVGDVLHFGGDFQKYVTTRDLTRQEGLVFRHLLRMILLCEEFAQLTPPGLTAGDWQTELREIAAVCTESCRQIDPESTDKLLETMHQEVDVVATAEGR